MFKAWFFVILFFVGAAAGFLSFYAGYERRHGFEQDGKTVVASRVAKSQKAGNCYVVLDENRCQYAVRFRTEAGQDVATLVLAPRSFIEKMEATGSAPLIYRPGNPTQWIAFPGDIERMPVSYLALGLGLASLLVGIVLVILRPRWFNSLGSADA